jgi:hypothetical protein
VFYYYISIEDLDFIFSLHVSLLEVALHSGLAVGCTDWSKQYESSTGNFGTIVIIK